MITSRPLPVSFAGHVLGPETDLLPGTCVVAGVGTASTPAILDDAAGAWLRRLADMADSRWADHHSVTWQSETAHWMVVLDAYPGIEDDLEADSAVVFYTFATEADSSAPLASTAEEACELAASRLDLDADELSAELADGVWVVELRAPVITVTDIRPSSCTDSAGALDCGVEIELADTVLSGELTLLPREDGSGYDSWGEPGHWVESGLLVQLQDRDDCEALLASMASEAGAACDRHGGSRAAEECSGTDTSPEADECECGCGCSAEATHTDDHGSHVCVLCLAAEYDPVTGELADCPGERDPERADGGI